ncbi:MULTISPECIES: hypothetical protein [Bradyrhizobium]|uniref:Uncharacterized protein n=1 Tax=Bradyrhizobium septentrionale TaxID=1404411 RepID=A0ABZ2NQW5_9BRAD|nr:hypothetical protein [Bradyrhizobium septentrionale]
MSSRLDATSDNIPVNRPGRARSVMLHLLAADWQFFSLDDPELTE